MKLRNIRDNILTIHETDNLMGTYFRRNMPDSKCKVPATENFTGYKVIDKCGHLILMFAVVINGTWSMSGKHSYHLRGKAARTVRTFLKELK